MKTFQIYVPCKEKECMFIDAPEYDETIERLRSTCKFDVQVHLIENNKDGLTKPYNRVLAEIRSSGNIPDFVLFMHSDVKFDIEKVFDHIVEVENKYDLIGFAGSKKMNFKASPLTWFTASNQFPNFRYGCITSLIHDQEIESLFNEYDPDAKDAQVGSIDGLCMVFTKKLLESDVCFDEQFFTDFYDLDLCMNCILKHKFKIGVLTDPVYHASVGFSVLSERFYEYEKLFRQKWDLPVPPRWNNTTMN